MKILIDDLPIYYDVRGEGIPLVILHGFLLDHEIMLGAFEPLFAERDDFQRIYVDMPGMGRTPARDDLCSSDAIIELMIKFVDKILDHNPFCLAGFSYGGYIARGVLKARQSQVEGLYLIAPSVNSADNTRNLPESMVIVRDETATQLLPDELAPMILQTLSVQTRPVIQRIIDEFMQSFPRADQEFLTKLRGTENFSYHPNIDKLNTPFDKPALILTGRHDNNTGYYDAFQLLENYTRASYATLDRAGHGVYLEQDTLYKALTHEWLDRVGETIGMKQPVG